jgi:xanthine dehydrogenase YagR molybdenum-binding subunit
VKLALTRAQMYGPVGHRGRTWQTLRLGLDGAGRLTALHHRSLAATSSFEEFLEPAANASLHAYASPAILAETDGLRLDIGTPGPMRAPGEASGSAALEVAIDEAAEACGMDPLDFRLTNYAETEPGTGRPYSSKGLKDCYAEGAKRFGWAGRPLKPRRMRDENGVLVGWGVGTALFPCPHFPAEARATLRADGTALVETAGVDMGQGAWTALAQIAAEALGLDPDQVEFHSGVSDLPDAGVAGGSGHTASAGLALHNAGEDAIARLAELASNDPASPLFGAGNIGAVARAGRLHRRDDERRSESYVDILARAGANTIVGTGRMARDEEAAKSWAMYSHGAVFAEVKVDPDLGQVRVTRLVGAFAAGRIINPRLVRSQYYGGMIWGLGFALQEEALADRRTGRIMNADLAEYHVPVNADVPSIEAILVPEEDRYVNPLGVKGVGEIGITGTVGAIANAVWHATGARVRRFPIRIEDLLAEPH